MVFLPVFSLHAAVRLFGLVLLIPLVPAAALAERPKIKPHHKVPKDWRKFVAAKNSGIPYSRPAASSFTLINHGAYAGNSSTSYSGGAIFTIANLVVGGATLVDSIAVGDALAGNVVKTGVGSVQLSGNGTNTYTGTTTVSAGGTLLLTPSNLGIGTGNTGNLVLGGNVTQNTNAALFTMNNALTVNSWAMFPTNFVISQGTKITLGGGSFKLPAALVAAINAGQLTLADAAGTVAVEVDPVTSEQTFVVNGVNIPWPDATHPLRLVAASKIGSTPASPTLLAQTGLEDHVLTAIAPAELTALRAASGFTGISPVPEPSSALLFLVGAGLFSQRRRRG